MIGRPPSSPLFPYTPLFRSPAGTPARDSDATPERPSVAEAEPSAASLTTAPAAEVASTDRSAGAVTDGAVRSMSMSGEMNAARSEEHTSELQSRQYLVCRLL